MYKNNDRVILNNPGNCHPTATNKTKSMELIMVSISPKCIAVYYPFHECGISLKDKSENMKEIDNNQNEIILFPPSSLFINVGLKKITSAYANFLLFEIHQHRRMKVIKLCPYWSSTLRNQKN